MSLASNIHELLLGGSSGTYSYTINNSLRFRSSASAYFNRTPSVAGNRQTWTWSGWVKRGLFDGSNSMRVFTAGTANTNIFVLNFEPSGTLSLADYESGAFVLNLITTQVFRDPSAWYHIFFTIDTTQATASNRAKLYVNGSQVTAFSTATYPSQNANLLVNSTNLHGIATIQPINSGVNFDGYMAEVNFIDGQALTPSSFGSINATTGVWQPARYTGSYGTNGFYLKFNNGTSTTTLGNDSSGNNNNWTTNNISLTAGSTYDWMIDSPTSYAGSSYGVGNYAVLNPLTHTGATPINANLTYTATATATYTGSKSSFGISSGKWYWEQTMDAIASTNASYNQVSGGVTLLTYNLNVGSGNAGHWGFQNSNGSGTFSWKMDNGTATNTYTRIDSGDIVGLALDMGAGTLAVYRNNTLLFTCNNSLAGNVVFPINLVYAASGTTTSSLNFGQRPFSYTPPSGFKSLCTQNLPVATIYNGAQYMAATLWTGSDTSTRTISNSNNGVTFAPDFVWIKNRSQGYSNLLYDTIRGASTGSTSTSKSLSSNNTTAEGGNNDNSTYGYLSGYTSSGFDVVKGSNTTSYTNSSDSTYVGWQWKAGGTAVTNTAGSITSQVSANPTAGFSIVTYTGTLTTTGTITIGHGLGATPSMIIAKSRNVSGAGWTVYHTTVGLNKFLELNTTNAPLTDAQGWQALSSTTFSVGQDIGGNAINYVAYCFAAIPGYSAFGSYTGNGSTDGPFIFTGMRPRWILIKSSSNATDWAVFDTSRDSYNMEINYLVPNTSGAETSGASVQLDGLSNGFKVRGTWSGMNASGGTYIYAAFAENPFQYSLAR